MDRRRLQPDLRGAGAYGRQPGRPLRTTRRAAGRPRRLRALLPGGGFLNSPAQLIAVRAVMGMGAAFIFPTTLSIIANLFSDRAERAKAIGLWGATAGMGFVI